MTALLQNRPPEVEHVITIHDATAAIDRQHPVGITIEGEAHGSATLNHRLTQGLQMR